MCDNSDALIPGLSNSGPSATILGQKFDATTNPVGAYLGTGDWKAFFNPGAEQLAHNVSLNGGGPNDPHQASNLRAQIAREQWADYKKRFQPLENNLLGIANNRQAYIDKNRTESVGLVDKAYAGAEDQIGRRMNSYGLQVTPEMHDRIARTLGINKSLSEVQAANMSDRLSKDQVQGIVGGGMFVGNRAVAGSQPQVTGGG